jgi:hypothetical protein
MATKILNNKLFEWECDDGAGFSFMAMVAPDGDIHLRIIPNKKCEDINFFGLCNMASVRIRMPVIGGGMHEYLYDGLIKIIKEEIKNKKT